MTAWGHNRSWFLWTVPLLRVSVEAADPARCSSGIRPYVRANRPSHNTFPPGKDRLSSVIS